ncbi:RNA polymerase sigma factor SigJ [Streptomyces sp. JNUCC 64]
MGGDPDADRYGDRDEVIGERRHLTNLSYRLLGSLTEAEDAVQETYARWYAMPSARRDAVRSPGAWLTTVAGRVCLDLLGSARVRRERYVGSWIPEPLPDRVERTGGVGGAVGGPRPAGRAGPASPVGPFSPLASADPADRVVLDESVHMAFLVVLETMTPAERVAFVLHDVFRYPFAEIAAVLDRTPAACRQLASSARRRVRAARVPTGAAAGEAGVVRRFKEAWEAKDVAALVALLDPDVTMTADGGGLAGAALRPVTGGERVAGYLVHFADRAPGLTLLERTVNGRPGLVARLGDAVVTVAAFGVADGRIARVWAVRNPEKLRPWNAPG